MAKNYRCVYGVCGWGGWKHSLRTLAKAACISSRPQLSVFKECMSNLKPEKVKNIYCVKCGELMVKIYPWSTIFLATGAKVPPCKKCLNKDAKELRVKKMGR